MLDLPLVTVLLLAAIFLATGLVQLAAPRFVRDAYAAGIIPKPSEW